MCAIIRDGPTGDADTSARLAAVRPAGLFWGSYLFIKIGSRHCDVHPHHGRSGSAALIGIVLVAREPLPRDREPTALHRPRAHQLVIPFTLITWGERSIDSALASILNSTVPLFTIVLAALALHDEPITVNRLVGLLVGFGGVILLTSRSLAGSPDGNVLGELAMIGSSISYAIGNVYARRMVRAATDGAGLLPGVDRVRHHQALPLTTAQPWT
jgi:drug/metabolite transporter (DMT)-like permease